MSSEILSRAAYNGTKNFCQNDIQTANATGFGAAADDYAERGIDLNEQLIMNKPATYFFRMNGEAMQEAGIYPGDVLVVDRSLSAASDKIIVALVNGELLVRLYKQSLDSRWLQPANKRFGSLTIEKHTSFISWGVVTCVIHIIDPELIAFNASKK